MTLDDYIYGIDGAYVGLVEEASKYGRVKADTLLIDGKPLVMSINVENSKGQLLWVAGHIDLSHNSFLRESMVVYNVDTKEVIKD